MDPKLIDEAFVACAARGVGLEIHPAHMPGVVSYFQLIAGMAESVTSEPAINSIKAAPGCGSPSREITSKRVQARTRWKRCKRPPVRSIRRGGSCYPKPHVHAPPRR